jgi:hypothetical protein
MRASIAGIALIRLEDQLKAGQSNQKVTLITRMIVTMESTALRVELDLTLNYL